MYAGETPILIPSLKLASSPSTTRLLRTILRHGCSDTTMPRCCTLFDEYTCNVNEALLALALAHWRHPAFGHHQTGVLKPM